jgi:hypothetical protein
MQFILLNGEMKTRTNGAPLFRSMIPLGFLQAVQNRFRLHVPLQLIEFRIVRLLNVEPRCDLRYKLHEARDLVFGEKTDLQV